MAAPSLRKDLVATPVEENGVTYVEVSDPFSGRTFRLYDFEYALATRLDGRPLDDIATWASTTYGMDLTTTALEQFADQLAGLGFLEGSSGGAQPSDLAPTSPSDSQGDFRFDDLATTVGGGGLAPLADDTDMDAEVAAPPQSERDAERAPSPAAEDDRAAAPEGIRTDLAAEYRLKQERSGLWERRDRDAAAAAAEFGAGASESRAVTPLRAPDLSVPPHLDGLVDALPPMSAELVKAPESPATAGDNARGPEETVAAPATWQAAGRAVTEDAATIGPPPPNEVVMDALPPDASPGPDPVAGPTTVGAAAAPPTVPAATPAPATAPPTAPATVAPPTPISAPTPAGALASADRGVEVNLANTPPPGDQRTLPTTTPAPSVLRKPARPTRTPTLQTHATPSTTGPSLSELSFAAIATSAASESQYRDPYEDPSHDSPAPTPSTAPIAPSLPATLALLAAEASGRGNFPSAQATFPGFPPLANPARSDAVQPVDASNIAVPLPKPRAEPDALSMPATAAATPSPAATAPPPVANTPPPVAATPPPVSSAPLAAPASAAAPWVAALDARPAKTPEEARSSTRRPEVVVMPPLDEPKSGPTDAREGTSGRRRSLFWIVGAVVLAAGGAVAAIVGLRPAQPPAPPPSVPRVHVVAPTPTTFYSWFEATGTVVPGSDAELSFPSSGRIDTVLAPGTTFAAGEMVARLKGAEVEEQAVNELRSRVAYYQQMLESYKAQGRTTEAQQTQVWTDKKKRALADAEAKLALVEIRPSMAGEIAEVLAKPGTVREAGTPVLRIRATGPRARFPLTEPDRTRALALPFCRVETIPGTGASDAAGTERASRAFDCSYAAPAANETGLAVDLTGARDIAAGTGVRLASARYDGVFPIPKAAVVSAGDGAQHSPQEPSQDQKSGPKLDHPEKANETDAQAKSVWVVGANESAVRRPVQIAATMDDLALVARGLKVGDSVIVDAPTGLAPGTAVYVEK